MVLGLKLPPTWWILIFFWMILFLLPKTGVSRDCFQCGAQSTTEWKLHTLQIPLLKIHNHWKQVSIDDVPELYESFEGMRMLPSKKGVVPKSLYLNVAGGENRVLTVRQLLNNQQGRIVLLVGVLVLSLVIGTPSMVTLPAPLRL